MRIFTSCFQCSHASLSQGMKPSQTGYLLDINNSGVYVAECSNGHTMRFVHDSLPYRLLYESGVMAMLSGFYLQAVSSTAAALERFFEFSIRILLSHLNIDEETTDRAWKTMAASSERQISGFRMLYLTVFHRIYAFENRKMVELRNDVVHKGRFPDRDETREYVKYVYEILRAVYDELTLLDEKAVARVNGQYFLARHKMLDSIAPAERDENGLFWGAGTMGDIGMLSDVQTDLPKDFESRLELAEGRLHIWGLCPARERIETSHKKIFLITEYYHKEKYTLEVQDNERLLFLPIDEEQLKSISDLPTGEKRAERIGQIVRSNRPATSGD